VGAVTWVYAALAWLHHPHGVVLVGVIVLGIVTTTALWPLRRRQQPPGER
jgi:hypothetical protein